MKLLNFTFLATYFCGVALYAQETSVFVVKPYLKDENPTKIRFMWETFLGKKSVVVFGK